MPGFLFLPKQQVCDYFFIYIFDMFGSKTCWKQNIFLLTVTEGFAVLYRRQTKELLLSLRWSLTQWRDSSAEHRLAPAQKGNLSFRPETTLPPKNTLFLVASTMSWDLQLPLLQSNWSACTTGGTCWLWHLPGCPGLQSPSEPAVLSRQKGEEVSNKFVPP